METNTNSGDAFGKLFLAFAQVISQNRSLEDFELTRLQAITLRNVYRHSGMTMTELAIAIGITRPQLTRIINTLEKRGLVHRKRNEDNRRIINVQRTKKGQSVGKAHMDLIQSQIESRVALLDSNDQKSLVHHLEESIRLMEKAGIIELGIEKN